MESQIKPYGNPESDQCRHALMGAPLIEGCLARFDCAMHQRVAAGDHDIIMGRVIGFSRHDGEALLYHGGAFQRLG